MANQRRAASGVAGSNSPTPHHQAVWGVVKLIDCKDCPTEQLREKPPMSIEEIFKNVVLTLIVGAIVAALVWVWDTITAQYIATTLALLLTIVGGFFIVISTPEFIDDRPFLRWLYWIFTILVLWIVVTLVAMLIATFVTR
jgi:hypothetical protein